MHIFIAYKGLAEVATDGEYCGGLINLKLELKNQSDGTNNRFGRKNGRYKGIDYYR